MIFPPAPRGAQHAQPREPVVGIEQGAGQGQGVEDFRAGSELLQIEGAEGDLRFAEGLGDGSEALAGAGEDGDAILFAALASLRDAAHVALNQGDDLLSLRGVGSFPLADCVGIGGLSRSRARHKFEMKVEPRAGAGLVVASGLGGGKVNAAAVGDREDLCKDLVEPLDQGRSGAEVGRQGDEVEQKRFVLREFKANRSHAREELGLGLAEEVDGLHGVADRKTTAALAFGPGGDQVGEHLMLAAARVLKLVDQQVADAFGDGEGGVGGKAIVAFEHALSDLRHFNEVHRAGLGKDDLELGGGVAEQGEAGADDLPFVLGIAGRGQIADGGEHGFETGDCVEAGNEVEDLGLLALPVGGEAEALVHLPAEGAVADEQQLRPGQDELGAPLREHRWRRMGRKETRPARPVRGEAGLRSGCRQSAPVPGLLLARREPGREAG